MISFAKKFLSIALAAVLLVGVVPAAAFAAEVAEVPAIQYMKVTNKDGATEAGFLKKVSADQVVDGKYTVTADDLKAPSYTVEGITFTGNWKKADGSVCKETETLDVANGPVTLTPEYTKAECQHQFDSIDGKAPTCTEKGSERFKCSKCGVEVEKDVPALGHKFGEWFVTKKPTTDAKGEETRTCSVCKGTEVRELDKLTPAVTYTVSFNTDATDVANPGSITVTENGTYNNLPSISRTGYNFEGWYLNGNKVENNTKVLNENHTLTAKWSAKYYTVRFLDVNGNVIHTEQVKHGEKIANAPDLNKAGSQAGKYATGWDNDLNQAITGDKDIKPIFKNATYTITLDPGVPGVETRYKKVDYGEKIGELTVPSRNRYVFKGWYLDNTEFTANTTYNMDHDITLKAKWVEEARVKLMIYRNGKTSSAYEEVQVYGYGVGDTIKLSDVKIENYYKNGDKSFKFSGWYDREGWTLFKAGDNPKPIEQIKTIGLDGTTVLFGMVTDKNAPNNSNPDNTNPKTGDESMIFATTAVMMISAGALAVVLMDRKRRNA